MAGRNSPPPKAAAHDTAEADDGKTYGLLLDARPDADGNATMPATPHTVVGLPGFYSIDAPTPVGGPGEAILAEAAKASQDSGCGLVLVEIVGGEMEKARTVQAAHIAAGRNAIKQVVRDGELDGGEVERVKDEIAATDGAE